jgi:hypothetical protein
MPSFRSGTVEEITAERPGFQRVVVDGERAYVLTELIGPVAVGDRVVMNTTAVELGLGTGGWHVVHWNLSRDTWAPSAAGREMKVRYTSVQVDVAMHTAETIPTVPVIACTLHSQLAAVAAAYRAACPSGRLVYVMTDGGALPLALSDLVHALRERGDLHATVTTGHAFGGDEEAATIEHGLAVAGALGADAIVAGMGPGSLGIGTATGFTGRDAASVLDAARQPIIAVRYSDADERGRHQGVSHHTAAVLGAVHTRVTVPVPRGEPRPAVTGHHVIEVDVPDLIADLTELGVTSMGRSPAEDPKFWAYAGAAGAAAAGTTR